MHTQKSLPCTSNLQYVSAATLPNAGRRGPSIRRRFQEGTFVMEHGRYFSMWYADCDGRTKRMKRLIGRCSDISERAARREHAIRMEQVNAARGSLAPIVKGQTFEDATTKWRAAIAPNLSPATVRAYESHLRTHIQPRFGGIPLTEMGLHELQTFATDLRKLV